MERLLADRELVDRVMWAGYEGREWERLRRVLAEYGVGVLYAWILSGRIFVECRKKGFGNVSRRRVLDADDACGLAGETAARALRFFRDRVLIPGRWDMTKGASLNTYFVGACILHFPNVHSRSEGAELLPHLAQERNEADLAWLDDRSPYSRPDRRVELADAVDSMKDSTVREILLHEAEGYTQDETAIRLRKTRWAIEGKLRKFRERKM